MPPRTSTTPPAALQAVTEHPLRVKEFLVNWRALVQTQEDGKHDILLVAARADHARLPVMMHRPSDCDMHLDECSRCHPCGRCGAIHLLSMSAEECAAHQHSTSALTYALGIPTVVSPHARINVRTARLGALAYTSEIARRPASSAGARVLLMCRRRCSEGEWSWKINAVRSTRLGKQDKRVSTRWGSCRRLTRLGRGTAHGTRVLRPRWRSKSGMGRIGGPRFCAKVAMHGHA